MSEINSNWHQRFFNASHKVNFHPSDIVYEGSSAAAAKTQQVLWGL